MKHNVEKIIENVLGPSKESITENLVDYQITNIVEGSKEEYQKFFKATLAKFGVKSPNQLSPEKRKQFFAAIKSGWKK